MSQEYWLADSEARVLGPIGVDVIRALHARGKLLDVRAVSRDGKKFVPLREMPELQNLLAAPATVEDATRAQADATKQIRDWLQNIVHRPTHEVFKVPQQSSRDAYRAAFFGIVHRYVPSRLPPDTTPELRLACEDAFLVLAERMVEVEKQFRPAVVAPVAAPPPPLPPTEPPPVARVSQKNGVVTALIALKRGDARPFTQDSELNWLQDYVLVHAPDKFMQGTPVEMVISFEGHVTQLHAEGMMHQQRPNGFIVKLRHLGDAERTLIRTWVARATTRP